MGSRRIPNPAHVQEQTQNPNDAVSPNTWGTNACTGQQDSGRGLKFEGEQRQGSSMREIAIVQFQDIQLYLTGYGMTPYRVASGKTVQ